MSEVQRQVGEMDIKASGLAADVLRLWGAKQQGEIVSSAGGRVSGTKRHKGVMGAIVPNATRASHGAWSPLKS